MKNLFGISAVTFALSLAFSTPISANQVFQQNNSNAVWFENWGQMFNATMTITAPDGRQTRIEAPSGTPVFQLDPTDVVDGIYRYEVTAAKQEKVKIINPENNGRGENARDEVNESFSLSGHFTVSRGVIVIPEEVTEDSN